MSYLCLSDIKMQATEIELRDVAMTFESSKSKRALLTAIEEVKGSLNYTYDVDAIFAVNAYDYSVSQSYKVGDVVLNAVGDSYTCTADAPANTPLTDTNFFEAKEPRNLKLVQLVGAIYMYNIHLGTPPNKIINTRQDAYNDALAYLKDIRTGKANLELPLRPISSITETSQTHTISIKSNPKRDVRF